MKKLFLFYCVLASFCFILIISVKATVDPGTIVGIWLFDQDGKALDSSGKGHDGKIEGNVKWVNGKFGKAIDLDGNSFVVIDHAKDMNLEKFTLMAWVKIPKAPNDWWTIAAKDGWPNRNYGVWLRPGTRLAHLSWTSGTAPNNHVIDSVTTITGSDWFHVVTTYDMKVSKLYINGKLEAQGNFTDTPNVTDVKFTVGKTAIDIYKLVGSVDDLGLFSQALSDQNINDIMANGLKSLINSVSYDINQDGLVNILDMVLIAINFGKTGKDIVGDANVDGKVDALDLDLLIKHFGEKSK